MNQPLISVAMCTYNGENYLRQQLDTIINQSYSNLEIVIVDDCSNDGTVVILREYAARDSRIRLIENEQNLGFVRNFSKAMQHCQGDYIALADQDDIWFENKIEHLYKEIGENLLIYSRIEMVDAKARPQGREFPKTERIDGDCAISLVLANCVTGHACLLRRELLSMAGSLLQEAPYHDQLLAFVAASNQGRLKAGSEVLSYYRCHEDNAVLGNKRRRPASKVLRHRDKVVVRCAFYDRLIASGLLRSEEQLLLLHFRTLYSRNTGLFYNWKLRRFLLSEGRVLLRLLPKKKQLRKVCRGVWYYRLVPFA
ncbi:glycosyltransferase [Spongiibacter marinus]|uniref:glycosyltransferase n=1 Tax=Spongiibacter marinus TaxID=354246 RepID=UPI001961F070|nr:glycosyltransferase involved in cell wall biosynthesis [Spongiibacter marinus]